MQISCKSRLGCCQDLKVRLLWALCVLVEETEIALKALGKLAKSE